MYIKHVSTYMICQKRFNSLSHFTVVYHAYNPNCDFCLLKLLSHIIGIQVSRKICGHENRYDSACEMGEAYSPHTLTQPHTSGYVSQHLDVQLCAETREFCQHTHFVILCGFQAPLFFRNTMMSDKKTLRELKEASKKPFLLLRGKRQHRNKAGSRGNVLRGRRSLTDTV